MAGLLDSYAFDPSSYGSTNPLGWLGQFLQSQPGASQGFPDQLPANASPTIGTGMPGGDVAPQPAPAPASPTNPFAALLGSIFSSGQAQAQPAQASAPGAPQAPSGGFGNNLQAGFANFANSKGLLPALSGAIGGFASGQRTDPAGMMQQQQASTYHALVGAGIPPAVAQAAALNPEVLKTIAPQLYSKPVLQETGTDPLTGQKTFGVYRPDQATLTPVGGGAQPGTMAGAPPGIQEVFDKIEQGRNAGAPVSDLLQQVPNSLREGVSAMIAGRAIPTNLSNRGAARDLAIRFAHQIDPGFDETLIPGRAQFARGMAQTTPNSPGGQKILLNTSLQHTAELANALVDLRNTGGPLPNVPGSSYVANLANRVGNSTSTMGETVNKVGDIAQKVGGEVGKLYSGSSGGGEAERQATTGRFSPTNTPQESIGALEATRNLIMDKLNALQNQRDQVYGATGENVHPLVDKQTQVALNTIDSAIEKLRGQASGTSSQSQQQQMAPIDVQALDWANSHANDPRAAKIKQRLGVQ